MCDALDNAATIVWTDELTEPTALVLPPLVAGISGFSVISEYRGCVIGGLASDTLFTMDETC